MLWKIIFLLYLLPLTVEIDHILHDCRQGCPRQCLTTKYLITMGETSMGNTKLFEMMRTKHNKSLAEAHTFVE